MNKGNFLNLDSKSKSSGLSTVEGMITAVLEEQKRIDNLNNDINNLWYDNGHQERIFQLNNRLTPNHSVQWKITHLEDSDCHTYIIPCYPITPKEKITSDFYWGSYQEISFSNNSSFSPIKSSYNDEKIQYSDYSKFVPLYLSDEINLDNELFADNLFNLRAYEVKDSITEELTIESPKENSELLQEYLSAALELLEHQAIVLTKRKKSLQSFVKAVKRIYSKIFLKPNTDFRTYPIIVRAFEFLDIITTHKKANNDFNLIHSFFKSLKALPKWKVKNIKTLLTPSLALQLRLKY